MNNEIHLGVNVDHVATVRQARGTDYPDPVKLALVAEANGADGITMHLREDRRHVLERDVEKMAKLTKTKLNMEMAVTDEMRDIALRVKPADVCLVPEKREELTTEGGLDVIGKRRELIALCYAFQEAGIRVSLFIDPEEVQIEAAKEVGAPVIELHTGTYADARSESQQSTELARIMRCAEFGDQLGLIVNAGHGLHYNNTQWIAAIQCIHELNIGHSIVARAMLVGFPQAVREMKKLMVDSRENSSVLS